jgi:hypothetical protein
MNNEAWNNNNDVAARAAHLHGRSMKGIVLHDSPKI